MQAGEDEPRVVHAFRLGPVSSSGGATVYAYVGLVDGGEPRIHEAPGDRGGLAVLKREALGQPVSCEPALAEQGKPLGLESAPLPPGVLKVRALLAYEFATGVQHGASKPGALAAFLRGAAAFWGARSWEVVSPQERLHVDFLEGSAEVGGELSVVGGDGMRLPGVALCDARGALEELARLQGDARAEAALRLANLTIEMERDPAWAAEAIEEGYGLPRVPVASRKHRGGVAPMVTQDLLVAAALLDAIAAWTGLGEEGALGEGTAEAAGMRVVARVRVSGQLPASPVDGLTPTVAQRAQTAEEAAKQGAAQPVVPEPPAAPSPALSPAAAPAASATAAAEPPPPPENASGAPAVAAPPASPPAQPKGEPAAPEPPAAPPSPTSSQTPAPPGTATSVAPPPPVTKASHAPVAAPPASPPEQAEGEPAAPEPPAAPPSPASSQAPVPPATATSAAAPAAAPTASAMAAPAPPRPMANASDVPAVAAPPASPPAQPKGEPAAPEPPAASPSPTSSQTPAPAAIATSGSAPPASAVKSSNAPAVAGPPAPRPEQLQGWLTRAWRSLRGHGAPRRSQSAGRAPRAAPSLVAARAAPAPEPAPDDSDPFAPFARALRVEIPADPPALSPADEAAVAELAGRVIEVATGATGELVSFPAVALEIVERVHDPKADARGVAGFIARDPALAADVVSVANSAAFRGVSEIESVHDAVARLGLAEVGRVASAVAARKILEAPATKGGARATAGLFLRAVAVAMAAAGAALRQRGARSDHVWLGGLLHDVGKALALQFLARLAAEPGAHLTSVALVEPVIERVHVEVGQAAIRRWALPAYLGDMCAHHHDTTLPADAVDLHLVRLTSALASLGDLAVAARAAREIVQSAGALKMDALAVRMLATDLKAAEERAKALVRPGPG